MFLSGLLLTDSVASAPLASSPDASDGSQSSSARRRGGCWSRQSVGAKSVREGHEGRREQSQSGARVASTMRSVSSGAC